MQAGPDDIIQKCMAHLQEKTFPCVAARAAESRQQIKCFVSIAIECPAHDQQIINFLYNFIDEYRKSDDLFHSAVIIFPYSQINNEENFDNALWQRLQALSNIDRENYKHDKRVSADPASPNFSFSLKEEAFYIIGLHPNSSRPARQLPYPAIVFNPHAQFEKLRETGSYQRMKNIVRKRDIAYSGSINPMLQDFGNTSEVYQYSGRKYDETWQCPFKPNVVSPAEHQV